VHGAALGDLDLVLGFDETHVHEAVVDGGAPRERSFTMRHFVRLIELVAQPSGRELMTRARAMVEEADSLRGSESPARAADNMADPLGAPWKVYRETAAEIRELSLGLVGSLFGVTDSRGLPPVPAKLPRRSPLRRRLRLG